MEIHQFSHIRDRREVGRKDGAQDAVQLQPWRLLAQVPKTQEQTVIKLYQPCFCARAVVWKRLGNFAGEPANKLGVVQRRANLDGAIPDRRDRIVIPQPVQKFSVQQSIGQGDTNHFQEVCERRIPCSSSGRGRRSGDHLVELSLQRTIVFE